jgi:hypothetical protein
MNPVSIGSVVFACVFGGLLLGMVLRSVLPEHHLSTESKEVIKLGMSLTATMSALVLALLIASAKSSYDSQRNELTQISANIILLDRVLAHYGPETKEVRELMRSYVAGMLDQLWSTRTASVQAEPKSAESQNIYDKIDELSPQIDVQRSIKNQALKMGVNIGQMRWVLFEQGGSSIPMPFLFLLVFWVTIIFLSFGLFAPANGTVMVALFLCALSVSGAIFMILELDRPFGGLLQISEAPLQNTFAHLGQ